ncbi:MAG: (d)CMP kinase [Desulfovibrio sp.]|nr:(d)CMP kinase [Desulfovibrio sp.]
MSDEKMIVAIDGPAGVGKSTLAKALAEKMRVPFLDTGAMFRILAYTLGEEAARLSEEELRRKKPEFSLEGYGDATRLLFNGKVIGAEIRSEEIGALASKIAARPEIRAILLEAQRKLGEQTSLVAEGRDTGTVVFPNATRKFFLEARPEVRAGRRLNDPREKRSEATLEEIATMIARRDEQDRTRATAPLRPAEDAIIIDTSDLDIPEVLTLLEDYVRAYNQKG